MAQAISVTGLVKTFGKFRALDELDLEVDVGEIHGFLGPNGSGKSTTIRVLLGMLRADSGSINLLGGDPWADAVELHKRLVYVPGDVSLWPNLSGGEVIDLLGRLRGGLEPARRSEMLERFGLDPTKKGRTYSKGNRQKVALVPALASRAELLILDEPTSGLDPLMEKVFQDCMQEVRNEGRTVLLSSHILAEIESLCDRVTIIREGRTVESGSLSDMCHLRRIAITVKTVKEVAGLANMSGVHDVVAEGLELSFAIDRSALAQVMTRLSAAEIVSLVSAPPTLDKLFMRHYQPDPGQARSASAGPTGTGR